VIRYNKLVRDRIPEIIAAEGKQCEVHLLSLDEYARCLDAKLTEEFNEYCAGGDGEELVDIVEVVQAIVESRGMTWAEFEAHRLAKKEQRGGFAQRKLLLSVTDPNHAESS